MDLQAFSFSLPYFYDKYNPLNYSNAFYFLFSQGRFIDYEWPEGSWSQSRSERDWHPKALGSP
jgi:hypothetical protein